MFVHLILVKLKPGVSRVDPRVRAFQTMFEALERKCPGIVRFEYGWNTTDRPIAYDFGVNMAFAKRADLDSFAPHPAAQEVIGRLREIGDWVICDYERPDRVPGGLI